MIVMGALPFDTPASSSGAYLTSKSFGARMGQCVMCVEHWHEGNDYVFSHPAIWEVSLKSAAIVVMHILDQAIPYEAEIARRVAKGELFLSHGQGVTPAEQRQLEKHFYAEVAPKRLYKPRPMNYGRPGHIAYAARPAIRQKPVYVILDEAA